jgi:hypothetical protein
MTINPMLLSWKRHGGEWRLHYGRRVIGCVVRDSKYPNMWRSIMPDGSLSDMANLSWAKNAVARGANRTIAEADAAALQTKIQATPSPVALAAITPSPTRE